MASAGGTPRALSIAGSDSSGGAGVAADLKAFARCGVHGMCAITAVTAQSTVAVSRVQALPGELILAQVRAVLDDIGVDAVKVGMLADAATVLAVARALDELPPGTPIVVDPVMVAESGARLLSPEGERALLEEIVPRASVLTPNMPEARALAGQRAAAGERDGAAAQDEEEEAEQLARALLALGARAVVLTGGHRERAVDLLLDSRAADSVVEIAGQRHADGASHGSGCTHSSLLAAQLALGRDLEQAARIARALAGEAVRDGLRDIGAGAGPVDVLGLPALRAGQGAALSGGLRPGRLP